VEARKEKENVLGKKDRNRGGVVLKERSKKTVSRINKQQIFSGRGLKKRDPPDRQTTLGGECGSTMKIRWGKSMGAPPGQKVLFEAIRQGFRVDPGWGGSLFVEIYRRRKGRILSQ